MLDFFAEFDLALHFPKLHGAVTTAAGQRFAIWRKAEGADAPGVRLKRAERFSRIEFQKLDSSIFVAEGSDPAVRREVHGNNSLEIAAVARQWLAAASSNVAPEGRAFSRRREEVARVFGKSHDVNDARQDGDGIQRLHVPNFYGIIFAAGGHAFAVGRKSEVAIVFGMQAADFFYHFAGGEVPNFDGRTSAAAGDPFSIGRKGQRRDTADLAAKGVCLLH